MHHTKQCTASPQLIARHVAVVNSPYQKSYTILPSIGRHMALLALAIPPLYFILPFLLMAMAWGNHFLGDPLSLDLITNNLYLSNLKSRGHLSNTTSDVISENQRASGSQAGGAQRWHFQITLHKHPQISINRTLFLPPIATKI